MDATKNYNYTEKFDVGQHKHEVMDIVKPTCADEGYTFNVCLGCGDCYRSDIQKATGKHSYNDGSVTKEPTCVESGEKLFICNVCGDEKTDIVSATGVHIYGSDVITKPATCRAEGEMKHTCINCSQTTTESIKKIPHTVVDDKAISPSFKKTGKTAGTHCSVCGVVITAQKVIPKLKGASLTKVIKGKKSFKEKWKKVKGVDGYQIQYCNNSKFKKKVKGKKQILKKITIKKAKTTKKTVKKLKAKKTYYVRIRAYKVINGKKTYSKWSKSKKKEI